MNQTVLFITGEQRMERLGILDQLFYKADQYAVANMVMGGASILEPTKAGKPLDARVISDHIAARLEKIPLLRKKFVQDPLRIGSVAKVDDPEFDIHEHIVVGSLPAPGGYSELTAAIAGVSARPLDISQLWRWTLLDGMAGGKVVLVCQMHHALFDGLGAMEVISSMYDTRPVAPEKPRGKLELPPDEPSPYALLGEAIAESTHRLMVKTPRFLRSNTLPLIGSLAGNLKDMISQGADAFSLPEVNSTSLNIAASSGTRSVAYKTLSLPEVKTLARHFHCTVNDIALLLYSFAMQHYFRETGEKVDFDLWCGMPISTRAEGASAGNQVTAGRINLHNTVEDAVQRLREIHADTVESKKTARPESSAVDTQALGELVSPVLLEGLAYLFGRFKLFSQLGARYPVFNALLSNVPGPRERMYIANGLLAESIPLIPAIEVIAVSGGITSMGDTITIGFHCDGETVLNPDLFVEGLEQGLDALRNASRATHKKARRARTRTAGSGAKKDPAKRRKARAKATSKK